MTRVSFLTVAMLTALSLPAMAQGPATAPNATNAAMPNTTTVPASTRPAEVTEAGHACHGGEGGPSRGEKAGGGGRGEAGDPTGRQDQLSAHYPLRMLGPERMFRPLFLWHGRRNGPMHPGHLHTNNLRIIPGAS